jgi:hypothetical protein
MLPPGEVTVVLHPKPFSSDDLIPITAAERAEWEQIVPPDHFLRRLQQAIDFETFRPTLASCYSLGEGRPPLDPVVLL